MPVAGRFALAIRLRFHNHAPQQLAIRLAFHQEAADQLGGNLLGEAGEEGLGEVLRKGGGYGSGFECSGNIAAPGTSFRYKPLCS